MKHNKFVSHDGREVEMYVWDEVESPKGLVKIAHGMVEHSARYDDFAKFLNSRGYIVVMNDHRGHGLTAESDSLGFEDGDMWSNNVGDQIAILNYCKEKYRLPMVMMGHSYGSFVTQAVIEENPDVLGFILCGSNYMRGLQYKLCRTVAKSMCRNKGGRYPAQMIVNLSFKSYEKKFPGNNAWLNRDESEVKKYNEDPLCTYICSANFYRTFMDGISKLYKKEYYGRIDVNKPILLIAGDADPVGVYGKGVSKLEKFYAKKVRVNNVTKRLYSGARHEILNETCKHEVYADVVEWLDGVFAEG
ncbi:MAG: lysophospholipase [Corallococcus sp.]|nr:lysophospholipase [Corallococcus sp.]MCM1359221.1 lysophospholipase [Corallococcus sp.]MCM1394611.1 lysophospholipase [Corallococcus sp.]